MRITHEQAVQAFEDMINKKGRILGVDQYQGFVRDVTLFVVEVPNEILEAAAERIK
jgi:hypothetical protein